MKSGKNILIWLAIFVFLTLIFGISENKNFGQQYNSLAYSDFMHNVKEKHVASVTIRGAEITGVATDGQKFVTYAPYSPSTVDTLLENGVKVDAQPQDTANETFWSIFISSSSSSIIS